MHNEKAPQSPTLAQLQQKVDEWIHTYGVRYFSELTNILIFNSIVSNYSFNLGLLMWRVASRFVFFSKLRCMAWVRSTPV